MTDPEAKSIPMESVVADEEFNCRGAIAPIDVADLARDIQERGLIQPVTVAPADDGKYNLIAGFRRYWAHKVNKMKTIFAVIRTDMTDPKAARFFNLAENLQRQDLDILQEAQAMIRLFELGVGEVETAERLGKSRGWVQIRYLLLKLPHEVQLEAAAGMINQRHIRELYAVYRTEGEEAVFEGVKRLKTAKSLGKKRVRISAKKRDPEKKEMQTRGAMFAMQAHIHSHLGNGLATRVLAWTSGEISDKELFDTLSMVCDNKEIQYLRPEKDQLRIGEQL
jgi:ParB family chromosome partitioning protein